MWPLNEVQNENDLNSLLTLQWNNVYIISLGIFPTLQKLVFCDDEFL